jgi:hypothetical protein
MENDPEGWENAAPLASSRQTTVPASRFIGLTLYQSAN